MRLLTALGIVLGSTLIPAGIIALFIRNPWVGVSVLFGALVIITYIALE